MKIKLNEEIKEYCSLLKLKGIRRHFEETASIAEDYEDYLHRLLTYELEEKDIRSIECRIRNAHFPYRQYIEDVETDCLLPDMQKKLPELITLDFIKLIFKASIFLDSRNLRLRQPPPEAASAIDCTAEKCYNSGSRRRQCKHIFEFPSPSAVSASISQVGCQWWR
ncbi:MAG: ATP-binding protein [Eubacteriales bacterium]|nr:ATP-binding protein [Eubacteriales bacterium]